MSVLRSASTKVVILTLVALGAAVGVGLIGLNAIASLRTELHTSAKAQEALHNQSEMDGANYAIKYDAVVLATRGDEGRDETIDHLTEQRTTLREGFASNRALFANAGRPALDQAFADMAQPVADYDRAAAAISATAAAGKTPTIAEVKALEASQATFDGKLDTLTDEIRATVADGNAAADADAATARTRVWELLGAACVVLAVVGLLIRRSSAQTQRQTQQIVAAVDAAVHGDLTSDVPTGGSDAVGQLGAGLARLLTGLRGSVGGIGGPHSASPRRRRSSPR